MIGVSIVIASQLQCSDKPTEGFVREPSPVDTIATTVDGDKTYLALGDSYTIGQGVAPNERYPVQAQQLLVGNGIKMKPPVIIATTGWTTINLGDAIKTQINQETFDVVSLLIGVNDQYQRLGLDGYKDRFSLLLKKAIQLAGNRPSRVFVLSIPDYSVTPFAKNSDIAGIRKDIDAYNLANKEITARNNCHYLDITPSTREASGDLSLLANDGLHPSGKEYRKWAERLATMMKAVLE
jgi:lysophospholipase L1-like esterase